MGDLLKAGKITIIVHSGTQDRKRSPELPKVPTLSELARTEDGKALTASYFPSTIAGRPFWLPAGVPEERVKILRSCGLVMLFSTNNGEPLAIINDGIIQHMRVGADPRRQPGSRLLPFSTEHS